MDLKKSINFVLIFIVTLIVSWYLFDFGDNDDNIEQTNIEFDENEHNFSKLKKDKEALTYFVYKNTGDYPLIISDIRSTCGCTIPIWSKKELASKQKDSILVSYDSKQAGKFLKSIYIVSNSKTSPDVIRIKGSVLD